MKGIYLSQEGKEQLEAKIAELEKQINLPNHFPLALSGKLLCLKEILSSAIVLPTEKSLKHVELNTNMFDRKQIEFLYPNGVIIQF